MFSAPVFTLPQQVADEVLADGGNDNDSKYLIAARMKKDLPLEDNAAFLRLNYKTGGKGFVLDGKRVSAWWDSDGVRIAYGNTAQTESATLITWEQAARRVRELLDDGRYMPQVELDVVDHMERRDLAKRLWYTYNDGFHELPSEWRTNQGFPEDTVRIAELLSEPETRDGIIAKLQTDVASLNVETTGRRFWDRAHLLLDDLSTLQRIPLTFTATDARSIPNESRYITQDEIDAALRNGSGYSEGHIRIYRFFQQSHTPKEQADFLKHEYGIGGRSHALSGADNSDEMHDSKGITFSRGNLTAPYAKITLNWTQVARRIGELIESGRYLSPEEVEKTRWEAETPKEIEIAEETPVVHEVKAYDLGFGELGNGVTVWNRAEEIDQDYKTVAHISPEGHVTLYEQYMPQSVLDIIYAQAERESASSQTLPNRETWLSDMASRCEAEIILRVMRDEDCQKARTEPNEQAAREALEAAIDRALPEIFETDADIHHAYEESPEFIDGMTQRVFQRTYSFRDEGIALVREIIESQTSEPVSDIVPTGTESEKSAIVPTGTSRVPAPAGNYRITDDHLGEGGQRTKADRNIEAIRTLKLIEGENRAATADEQETLAQYVGWGGISQIFDEHNTDWQERREALKKLLTTDEYTAARASTLNAHYTSPTVIRTIYQGLENLGFRQGNVLEPSCGIGNFFGVLPESMSESKLYGVELDSLTGRIAQKLYPDAKIAIQGFEHSALPDGFFDIAVGNVPFGAYTLPDPKYDRHHFRIHDYFFAKTLDKVRPGGVIAFVTSKGTLDKVDSSVRRYIAQRAELLGAIRLPNTAFKANAGTEVTTDILFLQKRDRAIEIEPDWLHVGKDDNGIPLNQYFLDHPEMILGTMAFDRSMYGNELDTTCNAIPGVDLAQQLEKAVANIQGRYDELSIDEPSPDESRAPADPTVPNFSFAVRDGRVYFRRDHWMERCDLSAADDKRARGMIALRASHPAA